MQALLNELPWAGRYFQAVEELYVHVERQLCHDWTEIIFRRVCAVVRVRVCVRVRADALHGRIRGCAPKRFARGMQGRLWASAKREDLDASGRLCRHLVSLLRSEVPPSERLALQDRVRVRT